ncbi:hypothetical protein S245_025042, partial [Arachis hypogaea]
REEREMGERNDGSMKTCHHHGLFTLIFQYTPTTKDGNLMSSCGSDEIDKSIDVGGDGSH